MLIISVVLTTGGRAISHNVVVLVIFVLSGYQYSTRRRYNKLNRSTSSPKVDEEKRRAVA